MALRGSGHASDYLKSLEFETETPTLLGSILQIHGEIHEWNDDYCKDVFSEADERMTS